VGSGILLYEGTAYFAFICETDDKITPRVTKLSHRSIVFFLKIMGLMILNALTGHQAPGLRPCKAASLIEQGFSKHQYPLFSLFTIS
jgi:hypothetical protein